VSAEALRQAAIALERAARDGDTQGASALAAQLTYQFERARAAMIAECQLTRS